MRKRSRYRPRPVIVDTMTHIKVGMKPLATIDGELVMLRIKNHDAMASIARGQATKRDIDTVIAALNIAEALVMQSVGNAYRDQLRQGQQALANLAKRGIERGERFICTGPELTAINWAMELHDAQLEVITVGQLETAIRKVANIVRSGGATRI